MPDYIESYFDIPSNKTSVYIGFITFITGIIGTYYGSHLMNRKMHSHITDFNEDKITFSALENYRTEYACRLIHRLILIALIAGLVATTSGQIYVFFPLFGVSEFFLFLCISPSAITVMSCVPKHLRGVANGMSSMIMNILGSATAPILIGFIIDAFGFYLGMVFNSA